MAFLESFPELSRTLRDFAHLCSEFENTYVYIRGFAASTLEKLRFIYEKTYRECVEDSVKLQKLLNRGIQAEQDMFAELLEKYVLFAREAAGGGEEVSPMRWLRPLATLS